MSTTTNIYHVTNSYLELLRARMDNAGFDGADVSGQAPASYVTGEGKLQDPNAILGVTFHLYHLEEIPHFKNDLGPHGTQDVAGTPMAVKLFYILTAHAAPNQSDKELMENNVQELMSIAVKAVHDFPIITDDSIINVPMVAPTGDREILVSDLRGRECRLEAIRRPMTPEEALQFWSSQGDEAKSTTKLSAYYEVRAVFLEPEPVTRVPGIVYTVGNPVFPISPPQIACTQSELRFNLPISNAERALAATPARAAQLDGNASFENNVIEIVGSSFTADFTRLIVKHGPWVDRGKSTDTVILDPRVGGLGESWFQGDVRPTRIEVAIGDELTDGDTFEFWPGIYSVRVEKTRAFKIDANVTKDIVFKSNAGVFVVVPFILANPSVTPGDPATITVPGGFLDDSTTEIELSVGGVVLTETGTNPPGAGEFHVFDSTTIIFSTLDPIQSLMAPENPLPINLIVNGAASTPAWLEEAP